MVGLAPVAAGDPEVEADVEAAGEADAPAVCADGLLPPPVEQALTSATIDAPRASMRNGRMGLLQCAPPDVVARNGAADCTTDT